MSTRQNPMHEHFADWHSRGSFAVTGDQLTARWTALQTILERVATSVGQRLELVRMAYQKDVESEIRGSITSTLQSADALFPMESNEFLLGVIACAALITRFETRQGDPVTSAALAVRAASRLGWKAALTELPTSATQYLHKEGQRVRPTRPPAAADYVAAIKKAVTAVTAQTSQGEAAPPAELGAALDAIVTGTAGLQDAGKQTAAVVTSLREQLNILWWLFGEHGYCVDQAFSAVDPPSAPLVIASDLASLTEVVPPPVASRAFLAKALRLASAGEIEVSTADAINATPREVREKFLVPAEDRVRTFTPVTELVRRSLETTNKSDWVAPGASATGYAAEKKIAPIDLAECLYEEQLLVRLSG